MTCFSAIIGQVEYIKQAVSLPICQWILIQYTNKTNFTECYWIFIQVLKLGHSKP